ncbi:MAG: T9SS type A sorting domain-containing protein [Bacteroidetes bacterium]|nr:T9SS type A sorting domain-containing protein [Bacteroidota bacterium]
MNLSRKIVILVIFIFSFSGGFSQEADQFLSGFFAVQNDEGIFLRWTIQAGNTCDGTRIQRFKEGTGFENIGEIPGVCGSPDISVSYDFTDNEPLPNKTNIYRLEMGALGNSSPITIDYYILGETGYLLQPNPVYGRSVLTFENPQNENAVLLLFDVSGRRVLELETQDNQFILEREWLKNGFYLFNIFIEGQSIVSGKVVVM